MMTQYWLQIALNKWAEQCIRLIESPETRDRLAERGVELVQKHYSYESFVGEISRSVSDLSLTDGSNAALISSL